MNLREATDEDSLTLEAFDVGDASSPWLNEVAEIVHGLVAWRSDPGASEEHRRVVVAEHDDEIVALAAHMDVINQHGQAMRAHRYLVVVAVRADQRRNGSATYLTESILADLQATGVPRSSGSYIPATPHRSRSAELRFPMQTKLNPQKTNRTSASRFHSDDSTLSGK